MVSVKITGDHYYRVMWTADGKEPTAIAGIMMKEVSNEISFDGKNIIVKHAPEIAWLVDMHEAYKTVTNCATSRIYLEKIHQEFYLEIKKKAFKVENPKETEGEN